MFTTAHLRSVCRNKRGFPEIKLDRLDCTHAECLPLETAARTEAGGDGQPSPDRRVYVSIKPDARGINLGKGTAESAARGIDRSR